MIPLGVTRLCPVWLHGVAARAGCSKLMPLCRCHHGFQDSKVKAVFRDTETVQGSCGFCGRAANKGGGRLKVLEPGTCPQVGAAGSMLFHRQPGSTAPVGAAPPGMVTPAWAVLGPVAGGRATASRRSWG